MGRYTNLQLAPRSQIASTWVEYRITYLLPSTRTAFADCIETENPAPCADQPSTRTAFADCILSSKASTTICIAFNSHRVRRLHLARRSPPHAPPPLQLAPRSQIASACILIVFSTTEPSTRTAFADCIAAMGQPAAAKKPSTRTAFADCIDTLCVCCYHRLLPSTRTAFADCIRASSSMMPHPHHLQLAPRSQIAS